MAGMSNVDPDTFTDYIYNIVKSTVEMGFKKIVLLDCHGNHDCLLRTVMRKIADEYNIFIMVLNPFALAGKKYNRNQKGSCRGHSWRGI